MNMVSSLELKELRKSHTAFLNSLRRAGECVICKASGSLTKLHYHHRYPGPGDKHIGQMYTCTKRKVISEIKKCDLLCASCHRQVHGALHVAPPDNRSEEFKSYIARVYGEIKYSDTRRCYKCHKYKLLTEFVTKHGRAVHICKKCSVKTTKKSWEKNPVPGRKASYKYYLKNKDEINRKARERYALNKSK